MEQTSDNAQSLLTEPENKLPDFTFADLPDAMRTPLEALGWSTPMPVQAKAIPYLLDNRDMIVQSRTGSGKTGAFLMPLLMRIDPTKRYPQALVLVPTRELAGQVHKEFETLSSGLDVRGVLVYGGVGYNAQLEALREGAQVIIGTPGRVLDHIGRRALNLDRLKIVVFDEADEMLSMGFYPDMREIRRYLPRERSSWMFSATMPYKVQMLAREFLNEPEFLSLSAGNVNVSTMEHRFYDVPPLEKDLMLMRLIESENPESAIIFCNTKVEVEYLATVLKNYGYNADQLSGDLDQKSREKAMERIRRSETRFLVATDVAARGIDISDLSHVFQYDVPKDPDSYVHRAGRTARAGNTGVVITLVANMSEKSDLKKITRKYDIEFVELPIPTQEEAEARMAERLLVVLGDRFRSGFTRLQRERMKRFTNLIRTLAENDEEHLLLAMLLDDLYQKVFHEGPPPSPDASSIAEEPRPAPARERDRQSSREPRREREPQREPQGERDARPEPSRPQGEVVAGDEAQGAEGGRKKKRKRKRNRNRNREGAQGNEQQETMGEGEPMPSPAEPAPGAPEEPQQPRREEPRREPRREEPRRDEPRREDPRRDEPRREEPRRDEPRREEPRREARRDEPRRDESRREEPRREEPRRDESRREEPRREGARRDEPRKENSRNEGGRRDARPEQKPERPKEKHDDGKRRSSPPPSKRTERGDGVWLDSIEVIEPDAPSPVAAAPRGTEVPEPGAGRGKDRRPGDRKETPADAASPSGSAAPAAEKAPEPAPAVQAEPVTAPVTAAPEIVAEPAAKPARPARTKAEPEDAGKTPAPKRQTKATTKEAPVAETSAAEPAPKPKRASKKAEAPAEAPPAATEAKPKRATKKAVAAEAPEVTPEEKPKRASKKSAAEPTAPATPKRKKKGE